jgi:NitT/TauT family transport system substrate-binding protein
MKRALTALCATASIFALAACGSGSPSGESSSAAAEGGSGELTKVSVGVIPIVDTAAIWLGDQEGFFEEEGLDLDLQVTTGGAAAVPGVVSDSFQFAFGNIISVMVAKDQGLDLEFVTNGTTVSADESKDIGAVVVPADSEIQGPADLEGKTVSVNNLSNIGDTTIRHIVQDAGGNPDNINFAEVAFPDAPAALANDQVDAAWILEPFLTQALEDGARVVSWNFKETHEDLDIAGYFTKGDTLRNNPELVEKFRNAMNKSLEYAQENPDAVREVVGTYTKIDEARRATMTLPQFKTEFNRDAAETLGAAAAEYGTLQQAPNLDELLP